MEDTIYAGIALLERTPAALNALLHGLPASLTCRNEGEGTWTVHDVIGHLIDCERINWMPRARMVREHNSFTPFPTFSRDGHLREGLDGDGKARSVEELLEVLAIVRAENLSELRGWNLDAKDLALRGLHPAFGPVTLGQLLAAWAAHDLTHLHQISRILAHPFREAVGPWLQYLGVLHCNAHGG